MKKILVLTMLYPSSENPHFGVFIKREVDSLSGHYLQKVIVPIPWRPFRESGSLYQSGGQQVNPANEAEVIYKEYFPLPGALFLPIKGLWFFLFLIGSIKKLKKNFDFDIIHAHNVYPEGFCAALLKKRFKKPLVVTSRGNDLHKLPNNLFLRPMIKHVLRDADTVITVSKSLARKARELGADPDKISVMPKGVDVDVFHPMSKTDARNKLGLPMEKSIILSVGWLIPRKNPLSFIKVLKSYSDVQRQNLLFVWVGEGPMREEMEGEIGRNELENYVKLVGRREPDEIATWMNAADIFMLVSFSEGMPNVLYEAMACGVPVIASNVDGASEIIEHGQNGILVSPNDHQGIAASISLLSGDGMLRKHYGNNAKRFIKDGSLYWENNAFWITEKYEGLYLKQL
ncbi:MAG: glycosyltransferase family 4 protein [Desulfovermiculus sp.]